MSARGLIAPAGWPAVILFVGALLSAPLIATTPTFTGEDWDVIRHGAELVLSGASPYADPKYRWSPVAAWVSVPLLALPYWAWIAAHVAAIMTFRDWRVWAIALVSWPFWQDAGVGNVITFIVLAGWWALRGNRLATIAYLILCVLMPRPLMLPLAAWLLWTDSRSRLPAVAILAAHSGLVALSGLGFDWVGVLVHAAGVDIENPYAVGPAKYIGGLWLVIGIPLAVLLTRARRLGLAGLAASPYWLPYYLLFLLLEVRPSSGTRSQPHDNDVPLAMDDLRRIDP